MEVIAHGYTRKRFCIETLEAEDGVKDQGSRGLLDLPSERAIEHQASNFLNCIQQL